MVLELCRNHPYTMFLPLTPRQHPVLRVTRVLLTVDPAEGVDVVVICVLLGHPQVAAPVQHVTTQLPRKGRLF